VRHRFEYQDKSSRGLPFLAPLSRGSDDALIEGPQRVQAGITCDLGSGTIGAEG
jgi:hypothetical protein